MKTFKKVTIMAAGTAALVMAGAGAASAEAEAGGAAVDSAGVVSGNNIQVPVEVPINLCGNSVNIIALLNPTLGNVCINGDQEIEHGDRDHHDKGGHHEAGRPGGSHR